MAHVVQAASAVAGSAVWHKSPPDFQLIRFLLINSIPIGVSVPELIGLNCIFGRNCLILKKWIACCALIMPIPCRHIFLYAKLICYPFQFVMVRAFVRIEDKVLLLGEIYGMPTWIGVVGSCFEFFLDICLWLQIFPKIVVAAVADCVAVRFAVINGYGVRQEMGVHHTNFWDIHNNLINLSLFILCHAFLKSGSGKAMQQLIMVIMLNKPGSRVISIIAIALLLLNLSKAVNPCLCDQ